MASKCTKHELKLLLFKKKKKKHELMQCLQTRNIGQRHIILSVLNFKKITIRILDLRECALESIRLSS
jgi:hypothetical protein